MNDILPTPDRITSVCAITQTALGLLEKQDAASVDLAAKALVKAGITLLGRSSTRVYLLDDEQHIQLYHVISTAKHSLAYLLSDHDIPDGVASVLELVHGALDAKAELIDHCVLRRLGCVIELERDEDSSHE